MSRDWDIMNAGVFPHTAQYLDPFHIVSLSKQGTDDSEEVNTSQISSLLAAHTDIGTGNQAESGELQRVPGVKSRSK